MNGYTYDENGIVYLFAEKGMTSYRLKRKEVNEIKAWISNGMSPVIFANIEDEIYLHPSTSLKGYLHIRNKRPRKHNSEFACTYVPVTFFLSL